MFFEKEGWVQFEEGCPLLDVGLEVEAYVRNVELKISFLPNVLNHQLPPPLVVQYVTLIVQEGETVGTLWMPK